MNHKRKRPSQHRPGLLSSTKGKRGLVVGMKAVSVCVNDSRVRSRQKAQERDADWLRSIGFEPWAVETGL